jgi:Matrixin
MRIWKTCALLSLLLISSLPLEAQGCSTDAPHFCLSGRYWPSRFVRWHSIDYADGRMADHGVWLQAFNLWMDSLNNAVFDGTGTTGESYEITSVTQWFGATGWNGLAESFFNGHVLSKVNCRMNTFYTVNSGWTQAARVEVAVHELGHSFGLDHVSDSGDIMRPSVDLSNVICGNASCPSAGAVRGVHALYLYFNPYTSWTVASPESGKTVSRIHFSKNVRFDSLDKLAKTAPLIVRGQIERRLPTRPLTAFQRALDPKTGRTVARLSMVADPVYVTDSLLRVTEVIQGDLALKGATIKIQQEGGETETRIIETADIPQLQRDQEVLLFLNPFIDGAGRPTDRYVIRGLNDGLLFVRQGRVFPAVREIKIKTGIPLDTEQEIERSALKHESSPDPEDTDALPAPSFQSLEGLPVTEVLEAIRKDIQAGGDEIP